ncbi:hypothetical protein BGZ60DRAFT_198404 [Tricladium varicosporioides]|nr:hypothetical protein BGZ60DRAFT_198404 [Hymenoscyphus varicosporioides]
MSFGWSFGDVVAGIKIVWNVYEAVGDGPRNARLEASQFFIEYGEVIARLEDWEKRKEICDQDDNAKASHQHLKERCTVFIKRHMKLIQTVNPNTKASRPGRSTWLRTASFTGSQIAAIFNQVQWPFERKEVKSLRNKLQFFLQIASWDVQIANLDTARDTNHMVQEFKASHGELLSSNLKLVSSHLDLVSLVTFNLKRVTHPFEQGTQPKEIDYPMLRQFDQALRPPEPFRAIEGTSQQDSLLWRANNHQAEYATAPSSRVNNQDGPFDNDTRGLISRRLDNMSMRVRRVEGIDTIAELDSSGNHSSAIVPVLQRLRDMRGQIGSAVGIAEDPAGRDSVATITVEPEFALRQELDEWNHLESRIEREILHPGRVLAHSPQSPQTTCAKAIDIPSRRPTLSSSPLLSPFEGWSPGPSHGSPDSYRDYVPSSPNQLRPFSHTRNNSMSSSSPSPTQSLRLDHYILAQLSYSSTPINVTIHAISRFDDGEVHSITSTSQDGSTEIRHSVDYKIPALTETSMKPFLDNGHLYKAQKFRIQFQGGHRLKVTKDGKVSRYSSPPLPPPIYKFSNENDYLEFQGLLLNKDVKFCADVHYIKSTNTDENQCPLGTIRILLDPDTGTRSILYFRHTSDQRDGFVEWPANIFKDPTEPKKKCKTLTLESSDGKSLSLNRGLSRRSTQGSLATIASFESTSGPAFGRIQERSNGKSIKGLTVEFYDHTDCHNFWLEFRKKEVAFIASQGNRGLGFSLPAELAA